MSRYSERPFLRLLESYVLSCIGHLEDAQERALNDMAPDLSRAFGINGSWFEIVSRHMDFPSSLPIKIKKIWDDGVIRANECGFKVDPNEFARQFVDMNFPET